MNRLTQQIAGAYIGAQVKIIRYSGDTIVGAIKNVSNDKIWITHKPPQGYPHLTQDWGPYDQCRLILTPLSAISDEDAVEVAKMAIGDEAKLQKIVREGRIFVTMEYGVNVDTCVIVPPAKQHEYGRECFYIYITNESKYIISSFGTSRITDYLRSRNYDLGYMHIRSLIDAGIAISSLNKTETK